MIEKYQKKPVVIEAVQWDGSLASLKEVMEFCQHRAFVNSSGELRINTLEGIMDAQIGDFIIKGVKGEFYPCKPDIFEQTYEKFYEVRTLVTDCRTDEGN